MNWASVFTARENIMLFVSTYVVGLALLVLHVSGQAYLSVMLVSGPNAAQLHANVGTRADCCCVGRGVFQGGGGLGADLGRGSRAGVAR